VLKNQISQDRRERFLLILLMANLAIAQPVFDLLGRQPEFLVAHGVGPAGMIMLALVLSLLIPAGLASLPIISGTNEKPVNSAVFYGLFALLATLAAMPMTISSGQTSYSAILIVLSIAAGLCLLYREFPQIRLFFRVLAPAVLIFPVAFLFFSRATPLLLQPDTGPVSAGSLKHRPDIVFIVLDEFPLVSLLNPDLEIDEERFPNFARLADMSNWYPAATTGAVVTVDAVPEALTGIKAHPDANHLPITAHHPNNLFTLLQNDYRISAIETATRLCPRQVCNDKRLTDGLGNSLVDDLWLVYRHMITPEPWVHRLPSVSDGWSGFGRQRLKENSDDLELEEALATAELAGQMSWGARGGQFRVFINDLDAGTMPGLFYLHSLLPHPIWSYLPDGRQYLLDEVWAALDRPHSKPPISGAVNYGHRWQEDEFAVNASLQRHLLQVMFVDRLLGELLDRLESQNMLNDSLLVIAGDHGASFIPGQPRRMISGETLSDISAIPLFIKLPGQESGVRSDRFATLADIMPTIADVLGSAWQAQWTGQSLLANEFKEPETISLKTGKGTVFNYPSSTHMGHLAQRAMEFDTALGRGSGDALFALGPHTQLLGSLVTDLELSIISAGTVILDAPEWYLDVRVDGDFLPRRVSGTLELVKPGKWPVDLAIAVNGEIQAMSRTFVAEEFRNHFAALLPPEALQPGHNTVEIYRVVSSNGQLVLNPLTGESLTSFELAGSGEQQQILDMQGGQWIVRDETGKGMALTLETEGNSVIRLNGSLSPELPTESRIVVFVNEQFTNSGRTTSSYFTIPLRGGSSKSDPRESTDMPSLRVFAVDGANAWELDYPQPCAEHWHFAPPPNWAGINCNPIAKNPLRADGGRYYASLDFGDLAIRPYLSQGFAFSQGNVSWSTGQRADLVFPLDPDTGELAFSASVMPFLSAPNLEQQRVYLLANDEKIAQWTLNEPSLAPIEWVVSSRIIKAGDGELVLSFLTPDAASPKSLDAGEDLRTLGLAFLNMKIEGRMTEN
jgi:hypothetical protein